MDKKNSIDDETGTLSPEEIKAIGEIELGPSKQEQFLNKHYKKLIVGGVALMVAVSAGICISSFYRQHNDAGSYELFSAAKVRTTGNAADPAAYDSKVLATVLDEYSDTDAAATAALMEGLSLLQGEGTSENGISRLEGIAASTQNEFVRARSLAAIASYYMGEGKTEQAAAAWKKVSQLPANAYTALAYVSLGDLARNAGDMEMARTYYDLLAKECPTSMLTRSQVAEMRLLVLNADDPEPVKPLPTVQPQQLSPYAPLAPKQQGGGSFELNTPALPGSTPVQPSVPGL